MQNECAWYDPSCALSWLANEIKALFLWIYEGILSGILGILSAIPVPDFLTNLPTFTIPPSVAWFADAFNLTFGLSIIVSAYTVRFIIRRLPFIG